MSQMDDERNRMIFEELQKECEWKDELNFEGDIIVACNAGNVPCEQKNCMLFKFGRYLTRPEVRGR